MLLPTAIVLLMTHQVICYDDPTIADLPEGVHKDLLGILTKKILSLTGDCDEPELEDINLHLYTRTNQNESIILNPRKPSEIDGNKKFVLIIHGWISSVDAEGVQQLKDAYLRRYDADIVVLDWSKLAKSFYATSVCSLPKIAKLVGDFLCLLDEENNLLLSEVHVVGHSLGGQMSGFIGNRTMEKCQQKIGRITGLDPAGPLFQGLAPEQRLEASDAEFVDIIHTNQGLFGYWGESGHADFYVNCGIYQMGCPDISFTLDGIKNLPFSTVACPHLRSWTYMAESINSDNFQARLCTGCPLSCLPNFVKRTKVTMGENCPKASARGAHLLATSFRSPFGLN